MQVKILLRAIIAVYCQSKCKYTFAALGNSETELKDGEFQFGYLSKSESSMFKFYVPPDASIHSISVSLGLGTTNTSMIRMFIVPAKDKNTLPTSESAVKPLHTWLGQSVRIYSDDRINFCTNCTYKVLVVSSVGTMFSLIFQTSQSVTKV